MKAVVAICGDPGGANAVAPVIELLRRKNRVSVNALAYLQASKLWHDRNLDFREIAGDIADAEIGAILDGADLLLTGTSVNEFELEKRFISLARKRFIPSLALLDLWSNYALRFCDQTGALAYLPDKIAVMDETAREEMIAEGIDGNRIAVTGHPAWDGLLERRKKFSADQRTRIRAELGIGESDWLVLYASQPPAFSNDTDENRVPSWLDRRKTVLALLHALRELSLKQGKKSFLLIRPHPREKMDIYREMKDDAVFIALNCHPQPHELTMASNLVCGMNTMFLVEAALLGCPTLSIRLGLHPPDDFPPNNSGLIKAIYREEDIEPQVERMLADGKTKPATQVQDNAGKNVAELIYSMLDL